MIKYQCNLTRKQHRRTSIFAAAMGGGGSKRSTIRRKYTFKKKSSVTFTPNNYFSFKVIIASFNLKCFIKYEF